MHLDHHQKEPIFVNREEPKLTKSLDNADELLLVMAHTNFYVAKMVYEARQQPQTSLVQRLHRSH